MSESLRDHAAEHSREALLVSIFLSRHALDGAVDAHLPTCNLDGRVEQI